MDRGDLEVSEDRDKPYKGAWACVWAEEAEIADCRDEIPESVLEGGEIRERDSDAIEGQGGNIIEGLETTELLGYGEGGPKFARLTTVGWVVSQLYV